MELQRARAALEQREAGRLADGEAAASRVEGPADVRRHQLQRVEAVERRVAEAVDAADHRGVGEPQADEALGEAEHLGARGAGGGDRHRRPGEAQHAAHELRGRIEVVHGVVAKRRRQAAGGGIAVLVGELRGEDSRGAGAEEDGDARAAQPGARGRDGRHEIVLLQREQGEPVVAAIEVGERCGQGHGFRGARRARSSSRAAPSRGRWGRVRCARRAGCAPWPPCRGRRRWRACRRRTDKGLHRHGNVPGAAPRGRGQAYAPFGRLGRLDTTRAVPSVPYRT